MAIYHCSIKSVSRATGRSAVAAAAYRAGVRLTNERDGRLHDFTKRGGVEHAGIILPTNCKAEWARDRSRLWNEAERAERRKDARVAREIELALPHELDARQRLELTREFARQIANRYGGAVDFAIHAPHEDGDVRNHHAHVLITTRQIAADGLGEKTLLDRQDRWLIANGFSSGAAQIDDIRLLWEQTANFHLGRASFDIRVDRRSHQGQGLEIEPTGHMGVHATQMERRGRNVTRTRLDSDAAARNARAIRERPDEVLRLITTEKSVFSRHDIARALHRALDGVDAQEFQYAFARVMASPALVELSPEGRDERGRITPALYSTRELVDIESSMAQTAERMAQARSFAVEESTVERVISRSAIALADEQKVATRHITAGEQIACVVGLAGAGKSTMLSVAREAWEAQGYRVLGAALSGKAAEGLEESSGIASRTLASWENGWGAGRRLLEKGDVLVIDEAGMVSSRQLASFIGAAETAGAKIVLVGDPEQLQPINAGAAFRAVAERVGFAELSEVRRQHQDWQRQATQSFAGQRTGDALDAYAQRDFVRFHEDAGATRAALVRAYVDDRQARPDGSRLALAYRRADVQAMNVGIRAELQERGALPRIEREIQTAHGPRRFTAGDRVIFTKSDNGLSVKNGTFGFIERLAENSVVVALDGSNRRVEIDPREFADFDLGYATTVHKSQGATIDRAFVLADTLMDRHLTYVAMSRHREDATIFVSTGDFRDMTDLKKRVGRGGRKSTTLDERKKNAAQFARRRHIENDQRAAHEEFRSAVERHRHETARRDRIRDERDDERWRHERDASLENDRREQRKRDRGDLSQGAGGVLAAITSMVQAERVAQQQGLTLTAEQRLKIYEAEARERNAIQPGDTDNRSVIERVQAMTATNVAPTAERVADLSPGARPDLTGDRSIIDQLSSMAPAPAPGEDIAPAPAPDIGPGAGDDFGIGIE